ncbi:MAG: YraN family protein [Clostridiales Family XIII bacterium]|jgi:putative endonuclease|nr:YraN family protein [Clostridiales Family XIII bacterium]
MEAVIRQEKMMGFDGADTGIGAQAAGKSVADGMPVAGGAASGRPVVSGKSVADGMPVAGGVASGRPVVSGRSVADGRPVAGGMPVVSGRSVAGGRPVAGRKPATGGKPYIAREGRRMSTGRKGEELAASHLELAGYEILRRNFACRFGEIDIIARPRGVNMLCFIEVKCRRNDRMGRPYETVGPRKQKHYRQVATVFLMREWDGLKADATTEYRFDVIEVVLSAGKPEINHISGAF